MGIPSRMSYVTSSQKNISYVSYSWHQQHVAQFCPVDVIFSCVYLISVHLTAGLLLEHCGTMCLCTVWLGNRVEAMEFPGGYCRQRTTSLLYS